MLTPLSINKRNTAPLCFCKVVAVLLSCNSSSSNLLRNIDNNVTACVRICDSSDNRLAHTSKTGRSKVNGRSSEIKAGFDVLAYTSVFVIPSIAQSESHVFADSGKYG